MSSGIVELLAEMRATLEEKDGTFGQVLERDMAVFVATAEGVVAAIDNGLHLGGATTVLDSLLSPEGLPLEDGDAIILNDPYLGSTHVQDFYVVAPVQDAGKRIFYLGAKAHLPDIGGDVEGGFNPRAQEIWAEGVRITPLRICRNGQLDPCLLNTILLNSRAADSMRGWIKSLIATLENGKKRIFSSGASGLLAESEKAIRTTEGFLLQMAKRWRDGEYRAACPVEVESLKPAGLSVETKVVVKDGQIEVDLSANAPQLKAPFNSPRGQTLSSALLPFLPLLNRDIPVNGGIWKVIAVKTTKGTVVDPVLPAPTSFSPFHIGEEISKVVRDAMGHFLSEEQSNRLATGFPPLLHWHPRA